jgi:hypothetical protein
VPSGCGACGSVRVGLRCPPGRLVGGRRAARPWGGSCGVVGMAHSSRGVDDASGVRGVDDTLNSGIRSPFQQQESDFLEC